MTTARPCLLARLRVSRQAWLPLLLAGLHAWLPWAHAAMGPGQSYAIVCSTDGARLLVLAPGADPTPAQDATQAQASCPWCLAGGMPALPVADTCACWPTPPAVAARPAMAAAPLAAPVRTWAFASRAPPIPLRA